MSPAPTTPTATILQHPDARRFVRDIAWRFAYLRRVVINEMTRALQPMGASVAAYHVMFRLATTDDALSQQELTLDAGLDAAGVSRLVAKMAKDKLVTIRVDPRDRRRRLVRLTAKGRAFEEELSPVVESAVREMLSGFTAEEGLYVAQLAERVVDATMKREQERKRRRRRAAATGRSEG
jgi:MarR family transcriptional regulator for hemolysin